MNTQARVDDARKRLDRLRVALASPSPREIEEALPELEQAIASMQELERALASGEVPLENMALDLAALAREVGIVQRLTKHGLELCNGWAEMLATATGGYVSSGKPAPLDPASRIEIDG
jgi:hypothetical protein